MKMYARGFSVVELMVAIAMTGTVVCLLLPSLQSAREAARGDVCSDNMRQLALALSEYHDAFESFPPALVISANTSAGFEREPAPIEGIIWSWAYRVAPFFGFQEFHDLIDPVEDYPFWSHFGPDHPNAGLSFTSQRGKVFLCPTDPRHPIDNWMDPGNPDHQAAITSYLGVNGRNQFAELDGQDGMLYVNSSVSIKEVADGISNTVILGERPAPPNLNWGWVWAGVGGSPSPVFFGTADVVLGVHESTMLFSDYFRSGGLDDPISEHRYHFWSFHPGGAYWAFVDGSVRFLTYDVDSEINETSVPGTPPTVLAHFATRAGGIPATDLFEAELSGN